MKSFSKKILERQNGITLIALVITIIVLLILAGVTVTSLIGENGILTKAKEAKEKTEAATNNELKILNQMDGLTDKAIPIYTAEQMAKIAEVTNNGTEEKVAIEQKDGTEYTFTASSIYSLQNDIDLSSVCGESKGNWTPIGLYKDTSATPADENNFPFKGIFYGNGYEINGIYIDTEEKVQGLFGLVEGGKVINLGVGENNYIKGGKATAGVVGYLYNNASIIKCYNKSNIEGDFSGGVVGFALDNITITECYNTGDIDALTNRCGGLVGGMENNVIVTGCYNKGNITNKKTDFTGDPTINSTGGIVGSSNPSTKCNIENCYNEGIITGMKYTGGIIGYTGDKLIINKCNNKGKILTTSQTTDTDLPVGGIVGVFRGGEILNSYNEGMILNGNRMGGICGMCISRSNSDIKCSIISDCYNVGNISSDITTSYGIYSSGISGLIYNNDCSLLNCYNSRINLRK